MAARDLMGRLGNRMPGALRRPFSGSSGGARTGGSMTEVAAERPDAPLGGTKAEAMQRLQVGVTGIAAMVFMVGLAGIIGGQADQADQMAVPDAAPTTEPTAAPPQRDPLADAGVVPDIPVEPEAKDDDGAAPETPADTDGPVTVPDTPPTDLQESGDPQ